MKKYAIWGMGLLGTSLALDLKKSGHAILCIVRSEKHFELLKGMGFLDLITQDDDNLPAQLASCDGIVFGTPIEAIYPILEDIYKYQLPKSVWITDMASTKSELMKWVEEKGYDSFFIGSHPMAGSDQSGPANGRLNLFQGATIYITAGKSTESGLVQEMREFWAHVGGIPVEVSYLDHDTWAAYLSHGLHVISCLVSLLLRDIPEALELSSNPAGGSFRDISRVAGSNPSLWDGIIHSNKDEVLRYLERFEELLGNSRRALASGEITVKQLFEEAGEMRMRVVKEGQV